MNDEELVEESLDEDLAELEHSTGWAAGAALWSTDWTAETVISQLVRGNIDLNPSFQRRSAWTDARQSLFIESLILGLPIPQLILAEDSKKRGSFIVIDGKQRLLAIRRFAAEQDSAFTPLKLRGLQERPDLCGKTYHNIVNDVELSADATAFENSSIRTIVIRNWKNEAYLYEVFLRINTGSVQLSPQELRQALNPGPFSSFIDEASSQSTGLKEALSLKRPDFRMRDAELLLRFLAYKNFSEEYAGNLKAFLDKTSKHLNRDWEVKEPLIKEQVSEMEIAFDYTKEVFGPKQYLRKWTGDGFEPRKNRAVFDIMLHFFSEPEIRAALDGKSTEIVAAFKDLCANDPEFLASIERTTKTAEANSLRFNKWRQKLEVIGGIEIPEIAFIK
ncbi:DUF262 domain-containing protein [Thalassospira sp. ER-Se-21-Dark]|nr:DUF262 domain-containing protein [Thalassospira sp. ER-Se-21-Dark]